MIQWLQEQLYNIDPVVVLIATMNTTIVFTLILYNWITNRVRIPPYLHSKLSNMSLKQLKHFSTVSSQRYAKHLGFKGKDRYIYALCMDLKRDFSYNYNLIDGEHNSMDYDLAYDEMKYIKYVGTF